MQAVEYPFDGEIVPFFGFVHASVDYYFWLRFFCVCESVSAAKKIRQKAQQVGRKRHVYAR